jgi:hypothetical protein
MPEHPPPCPYYLMSPCMMHHALLTPTQRTQNADAHKRGLTLGAGLPHYRIFPTTLSTRYSTHEPRRRAAAALARRKPAGAAALADEERARAAAAAATSPIAACGASPSRRSADLASSPRVRQLTHRVAPAAGHEH